MGLKEELYNSAIESCHQNFLQDDIDCEEVLSQIADEVEDLKGNLENVFKELAKAGKTKSFVGFSISYDGQGLDYVWGTCSPNLTEGAVGIEIHPLVSKDTGQWLLGNYQRSLRFAEFFYRYIKKWIEGNELSVVDPVYFDTEEYVRGFEVSWVDINREQLEEAFSQTGGCAALKEGIPIEDILA